MRILSLQPSISLVLRDLDRLDWLAGCTRYCLDAVPALRTMHVPVVHDSWSTTAEEIVALSPELVMASVPYRQESLAAILKAGFPVLALAPHRIADIYNDIRLIGSVVGAASRAEAIVASMKTEMAAARERSAGIERKPLVYCEEWGKPLIHSQPWVGELVEAVGGIFLGEPGRQTTTETIAAADPDVIVMAWCGAGDRVPVEKVVAQRGWGGLRAVRNGRVVCIPDELLNTPAPTLMDGLAALGRVIHPEAFGGV